MPRRSSGRRDDALARMQSKVAAMAGTRSCNASHELAEAADADTRPILLMATPGCTRCAAIRERQRLYDLAHPPAPPAPTATTTNHWGDQ